MIEWFERVVSSISLLVASKVRIAKILSKFRQERNPKTVIYNMEGFFAPDNHTLSQTRATTSTQRYSECTDQN